MVILLGEKSFSCDNNSQIYGDFIGEKSPFQFTDVNYSSRFN